MKDASVAAAVRAHTRWIKALLDHLDRGGQGDTGLALDDRTCEVGRWLRGEGRSFESLAEFARLKDVHQRFHASAREIIRLADAGNTRAAYNKMRTDGEFARLSTALILAFDALDEKVHVVGGAPR